MKNKIKIDGYITIDGNKYSVVDILSNPDKYSNMKVDLEELNIELSDKQLEKLLSDNAEKYKDSRTPYIDVVEYLGKINEYLTDPYYQAVFYGNVTEWGCDWDYIFKYVLVCGGYESLFEYVDKDGDYCKRIEAFEESDLYQCICEGMENDNPDCEYCLEFDPEKILDAFYNAYTYWGSMYGVLNFEYEGYWYFLIQPR